MKLLVCGGRHYHQRQTIFSTLDSFHADRPITQIIHGAARGADTIAGQWAQARGLEEKRYQADWKQHGREAGFIRNREMLEESKPDMVLAFPGGRGTAHTVDTAKAMNLRVVEVGDGYE